MWFVNAIVALAKRGKWWALGIGTLMFGVTWLLNFIWPDHPFQGETEKTKAGIEEVLLPPAVEPAQ